MVRYPACWVIDLTQTFEHLEPLMTQFSHHRSKWAKAWVDDRLEEQLMMSVLNKYPEANIELSVLRLNTYDFNHNAEQIFFDTVRSVLGQFRGDCSTAIEQNLLYVLIYDS